MHCFDVCVYIRLTSECIALMYAACSPVLTLFLAFRTTSSAKWPYRCFCLLIKKKKKIKNEFGNNLCNSFHLSQ